MVGIKHHGHLIVVVVGRMYILQLGVLRSVMVIPIETLELARANLKE